MSREELSCGTRMEVSLTCDWVSEGITKSNDSIRVGDAKEKHSKDSEDILDAVASRRSEDGTVVEYQRRHEYDAAIRNSVEEA